MNWTDIRTLNNSQNDGFEELVCQLAKKESINSQKNFYRNGKPDGGVECYWVLRDSQEIAWQAKFFTSSLTDVQWRQIDKSVSTALNTHPNLSKYIIALPIDPPDARILQLQSMRDKWNNEVEKWQRWATAKGMSVDFEPWWSSDIIERLARPENVGLKYFFFNEREFTTGWFKRKNEKSIADLGVRYTPKLNIELDIAKIFDGLLRNEEFYSVFYSALDDLLVAAGKVLKYCKLLPEHQDNISKQVDDIKDILPVPELLHNIEIPVQQYNNLLRGFTKCCDTITDHYLYEEEKIQKEHNESRFYHKYGSEIHYLRELHESIDKFNKFINSEICGLANSPFLLLEGDAGVGKSHLFADIVNKANENSILLLGQYFISQEDPWIQIKKICEIDCSEEEFFGSLNAKAESEQKRIIFFIDAANEGSGKFFWKQYINGFITSIKKYDWLGLAISVRSSYTNLLFPKEDVNGFIRYRHDGFGQKRGDAIQVYFEAYHIPLPDMPILQAEFQNPLFLKLYCIGQQEVCNKLSKIKINHLDTIIENYISGVENRLASRLYYNSSLNIVKKAINKIIRYIIDNNTTHVDYDTAYTELNALCKIYDIAHPLLDEFISEGIFIKNTLYDGTEYIYFAYERLGDYLIAKHLLEKTNIIEKSTFIEGGELFKYVQDIDACLRNRGIIEAFYILVPLKTGKEFFEYIPHARDYYFMMESFLDSLVWRQITKISDTIRDYLNLIIEEERLCQQFWNICLSLSTIPNHALNANFLHQHLNNYSLADRDSWWIPFLKNQWTYDSPTKSIINWAWSIENKSHVSNESVKLTAITLAWFLSSTNRHLRDSATKALICLLKERTDVLLDILRLFENVNDPYIFERLYAVAYGCAVRIKENQQLTDLGNYVYETIFKDKEEIYPHILLRDYARGVIEYASYMGCSFSFPLQEIRPPYHSTLPNEFPSNEDIDTEYKLDYKSPDYRNYYSSQNAILHSMVTEYGRGVGAYGDFGRYVFQAGLSCFEVDYNGLSNYAVKLIFEKYGYNKDIHGEFDRMVESFSWYSKGVRNERIGKKYQWIAFYELLARVTDNCIKHESSYSKEIEPYTGPWNPYVRDIDPTILIRNTGDFRTPHRQHWWEITPNIDMGAHNEIWITQKNDLPSPEGLIELIDKNGEAWLALEYHPEWREEKYLGEEEYNCPKKQVWYQIRSYLIKNEDYQKFISWGKNKNFSGRWMPEKSNWYELYRREYYWSPIYNEFDKRYADDSDICPIHDDATKSHVADIILTTKGYFWEEEFDQSKESAFNINIPSKFIYDNMHLQESDIEGVFLDKNNQIVCFDPSVNNNSFYSLLIKKDAFIEFLQNNQLQIVWTLLGEKQIIGGHDYKDLYPLEISGLYYLDKGFNVSGNFSIYHQQSTCLYEDDEDNIDIEDWFEFDEEAGIYRFRIDSKEDMSQNIEEPINKLNNEELSAGKTK